MRSFVTGASEEREVWSFFSGAMGLDLGLEEAGLIPTLACEIHDVYCKTIRLNRPKLKLLECDVSDLSGDQLRRHRMFDGDVFLMAGGPPCQPFSSGGKRAALNDPRGNLIYEFLRLIGEVRPQFFILENVANLATAALSHRPISQRPGKRWSLKSYDSKNGEGPDGEEALRPDEMAGSALRSVLNDAEKLGYHLSFGILDAADFGAPQHRLRFVLLGSRDCASPLLPAPTHGSNLLPYVTVRDAIGKVEALPGPHSEYTEAMRRYFDLVEPGKNWRSLPPHLQKEALGGAFESGGGKTGFFRRLSWDTPSPTITGKANRKGSAMCHPASSRPLSVKECALLQGFPTKWRFVGAMNHQYMQIGNAVPVKLGAAVGRSILNASQGPKLDPDGRHLKANRDEMLADALSKLRAAARNKVAKKTKI